MTDGENMRALAAEILLENEQNPEQFGLLGRVLEQYAYLPKRDRAFLTRLVEGTTEQQIYLDSVLDHFSKVPVRKLKPYIRVLLRCSVYQLLFMDSVPDSAVCNEAVRLTAKKGFHGLKGFVNGVLRNIARHSAAGGMLCELPSVEEDALRALSVRYSMPEWIVADWLKMYPPTVVERMLKSFLDDKRLTAHVNLRKNTPAECIRTLAGEGIHAEAVGAYPEALILKGVNRIADSRAFAEGRFWIQDLSSMMVCEAAQISADTGFVVDVCAAPGGKSLHAASRMGEKGVVSARDVSEAKRALIEENRMRLGFGQIQSKCFDGRRFDAEYENRADVVLADVPCSGLGVLAGKPDIKYHMTKEKQQELVKLQREILRQAVRYVRPGGLLIYSTCTIHAEENELQAQWIAKTLGLIPEALPEKMKTYFAPGSVEGQSGCMQLLPGIHPCDGFFIARFRKER